MFNLPLQSAKDDVKSVQEQASLEAGTLTENKQLTLLESFKAMPVWQQLTTMSCVGFIVFALGAVFL